LRADQWRQTRYILEAFKSLFKNASANFFVESVWKAVAHDVCDAAALHETHCDEELVAGHPGAADAKDVGMFREGHELGLALEELERLEGEGIEVDDFEGAINERGFG
jgi:hypothetical protein